MDWITYSDVSTSWHIDVFPTRARKMKTVYCFSEKRADEIIARLAEKYPDSNIYVRVKTLQTGMVYSGHETK